MRKVEMLRNVRRVRRVRKVRKIKNVWRWMNGKELVHLTDAPFSMYQTMSNTSKDTEVYLTSALSLASRVWVKTSRWVVLDWSGSLVCSGTPDCSAAFTHSQSSITMLRAF